MCHHCPMKKAKPHRYQVDRVGTPDPELSEYYVIDVVHDFQARAQLRGLVRAYRSYGSSVAADELEELLDTTAPTYAKVVADRQEAAAAALKKARKRR